jgi:hypothetical protein
MSALPGPDHWATGTLQSPVTRKRTQNQRGMLPTAPVHSHHDSDLATHLVGDRKAADLWGVAGQEPCAVEVERCSTSA